MNCPLCGGAARLAEETICGYEEGTTYAIYECEGCAASYVFPLEVKPDLYEKIYRNIQLIPAYNRYFRFATNISSKPDPLAYLGKNEETYWAVAHILEQRAFEKPKILEIGCGLGYLTFSLIKRGYDAHGVDISINAIRWATEHFGPYYQCISAKNLVGYGHKFDLVIMTELIEHLPDVRGLFRDALALLNPNGEIICTTPNKSAVSGNRWATDLPPVHLWWFSELSLIKLGAQLGCDVSFVDFAQYYKRHFKPRYIYPIVRERQPYFNANGSLICPQQLPQGTSIRGVLERLGIFDFWRTVRKTITPSIAWSGSRGEFCAAVYKRKQLKP